MLRFVELDADRRGMKHGAQPFLERLLRLEGFTGYDNRIFHADADSSSMGYS